MKILSFAVILLAGGTAFGQTVYQFLNLDVSAREASLAGSVMARTDDPTGFYYNPALSVASKDREVTFGFLKHILDINAGYLFSTFHFPDKGYFGVGVGYINYGSFTTTDEMGNEYGTFSAGDAVLTLNYSNYLADNFSYGVNVKGIYSSIASANSAAAAFDVGLYYNFPDNLFGVGFSILNVGKQLSTYGTAKESLPFNVRIGVSKQLEHLPVILNLAFQRLGDSNLSASDKLRSFVVGADFLLSDNFHVRVGYDNLEHQQMKVGLSSGIEGLSFGVGLKFYGYGFDYSYSSWGKIGAINRVNLTTAF
ncbi:MAG: type IX secretion system protein PorQ [Bacteroidetes bacterium]|nr:type IX secretion system protein PorQ [Bacteroidota bacterium]MCL5737027.1 type IX secretion system protein PorQ [Bacteroidota bacterium]